MGNRVILCADGTWNTPHGVEAAGLDTNVRKLYSALADAPDQLRYYDSGVGTDGTPIDHLTGGTMGKGLFEKIQDNYEYLAYVWDPGDDVYLFGFSRGAYTARSLGGMIARFGVPTRNFDNMTVKKIFDAYRMTDAAQKDAAKAGLTAEYGLTDVSVKMIGVWDTVGSLGIPGLIFSIFDQKQYGFLDTTLHPNVQKAYHAVSIDERRAQFMPTLWSNPDGTPRANDAQVTQVWFPGVHCSVGGSDPQTQLSDITMRWMMKKAIACGLTFTDAAIKQYLAPALVEVLGSVQDEWKIIPWGIPKHRTLPANAVMSNTVQMRLNGMAEYAPENLTMNGRVLQGYGVEDVLG